MRFFIILLLLSCSCMARADHLQFTQEELNWLNANRDNLVLSFETNFPPVEFLSPNRQFTGLSADLMAALEERMNISLRKHPTNQWTDVLEGLRNGTTAVAPAITPTLERQSYVIFTKAYAEVPLVIMTRHKQPANLTLDSLDGLVVDVVRGYTSTDLVKSKAKDHFTVREVGNIREALHDVSFGLADAVVENLAVASWYIDKEGITNMQVAGTTGVTEQLAIGVSKKYPLLASAIQKTLDAMPPEELRSITNKWVKIETPFFDAGTLLGIKIAAVIILIIVGMLLVAAWFLRKRLREKITDLTETQSELTDQLQRIRLALEATNAGYWEYYPQEDREEHSDEWYTLLGYVPQNDLRTITSWKDLLHPEDKFQATCTLQSYIRTGGRGMYQSEFRLLDATGSWRWILGKGKSVTWDEYGQPTKIIGLNIDIHNLKLTQESLRKSEALTKSLFEQSFQLMGLIDLEGNLLMCNKAALDLVESTDHEVVGLPFWKTPWWQGFEAARELLEEAYTTARSGKIFRQEIFHPHPSGTMTAVDFSISPLHDNDGSLLGFIAEGRDIATLKKMQIEAEENERCFRTIFECAPYAIAINRIPGGKYIDANPAFLDRIALDRDTLLTKTPDELGILPHSTLIQIRELLKNGRPIISLETTIFRKNGEIGQVLYSAGKVTIRGQKCLLSIVVDISDLKNAQEALRRSEELFSRLFHLSPDMIALAKQSDGSLLEINEAFTRFTGYSREEALGQTTLELGIFTIPSQRQDFADILLRDKRIENFEFDLRHREGHVINCSASARLLLIDNEPCILSITRDITDKKNMQELMVQSEKMLSLGGIAAGIAHEINNPLGIILQAAQTLTVRTDSTFPKNINAAEKLQINLDDVVRYMSERKIDVFIRDIEGAAVRAAAIIKHMLDFSRKSESKHSSNNIHGIINRALILAANYYDLKRNFDFKTITIIRDFTEGLPDICCMETEIEQVLLNLFRNAAQAMAESSSEIVNPRLRISTSQVGNFIRIEVEDNGPGIAPDIRSRIFEPFFTTKAPGSGTGLGLSVSYFIIAKGHDGNMHVSSIPGQGTVFTIDLPVNSKPEQCPALSKTGRKKEL